MIFPSFSNDFPMIFPWFSHDFPMIFQWFSHDFPMIFSSFSYHFLIIFPWIFRAILRMTLLPDDPGKAPCFQRGCHLSLPHTWDTAGGIRFFLGVCLQDFYRYGPKYPWVISMGLSFPFVGWLPWLKLVFRAITFEKESKQISEGWFNEQTLREPWLIHLKINESLVNCPIMQFCEHGITPVKHCMAVHWELLITDNLYNLNHQYLVACNVCPVHINVWLVAST